MHLDSVAGRLLVLFKITKFSSKFLLPLLEEFPDPDDVNGSCIFILPTKSSISLYIFSWSLIEDSSTLGFFFALLGLGTVVKFKSKRCKNTPSKNKLFRKNEFRTNGCLHENRGINSFSQLRDERISSSSKRGPSYTGPAKPPNSPIFLADLVIWPGLCSSALAWTMTKYAHLGVGWTILRPGFHGGVHLSGTHFF